MGRPRESLSVPAVTTLCRVSCDRPGRPPPVPYFKEEAPMRALMSLLLAVACAVPLTVLATAHAPAKDDGLHADWIDKSVDPAQDFFDFANGGWLKANPIPGDHSSYGSFDILDDHNQGVLKQVVESAGKKPAKKGSDTQK